MVSSDLQVTSDKSEQESMIATLHDERNSTHEIILQEE